MKVLITDYPDSMVPDHDYEKKIIKSGLEGCEVEVYPYLGNKEELLEKVEDVDAILTAFLPIDKEVMNKAKNLKIIALNATGYDNVDLSEANKRKIGVSPVGEYCTEDVAEFTMALMFDLIKGLKKHTNVIEQEYIWKYDAVPASKRMSDMTLGIVGLGRIGRRVAKKAIGMGIKVIANDPYIDQRMAKDVGVEMVSIEELCERSDIVSNHMNLNETNHKMFDKEFFGKLKNRPIFINTGRGPSVVEEDLLQALDSGKVQGAALDVLYDETPDLRKNPLANREDVIITPHTAFYTTSSIMDLQRISCENIVYYLNGKFEKVFKLVNKPIN